jgi:hydroxylamine reductase
MSNMFCFQCEQTAGGKGCTNVGVCGKKPEVANKQDELTCTLIGLARATAGKSAHKAADELIMQGLFATITNVNFDPDRIDELTKKVTVEKEKLGGADNFPIEALWSGDTDIVSLRSTLLLGIRGMAAYAIHAYALGKEDKNVTSWFYKGMKALGEDHTVEGWLELLMEFGQINLKCMALLDEANTSAYGHPVPVKVTTNVEKGPFIVVSGHDLLDLKQLLEQTEGTGINICTHGEMLPAHGYPELKKYSRLKGNFGTAWQNQQKEFDNVPAAFLFTTNCLMAPKAGYADRVFTTSVVGYPALKHIPEGKDGIKDFSPVIQNGGLPRIMDMGQCNDAYSAIQVAVTLAGAFDCGVNELPLTFVFECFVKRS